MDLFAILTMLGGLALFLYGMDVMGSSLEKVAGGRLERTLEKLTNNPLKGVALGALVTAVIQSSSATTVMVVGFVNSGIMKLSQAIGIIMGANIGTTITAWLLSLTGIESSNPLIQMLKPDSFSPVLAIIGIILIMFAKSGKKKDVGSILIGFAVLMFGMSTMSNAVKPLAHVPEFANILLMFSNPVLGVLAGAVLTAIIQSSSASVGILQALTATGSITYGSAIPIILGQNIGTCATALISCIGANKNAKRAAMVHLYFNIIGTVIFLVGFYLLNAIIGFDFIQERLNAANIAVIHTAFNVAATFVLLPFSKFLGKLATLTIRESKEEDITPLLDERFLNSPSFAIEQCTRTTAQMAELSKSTLLMSLDMINKKYDNKIADTIIANEDVIDQYEDRLGTYLVQLSSKQLSEKDSKQISKLLNIIGDFERIADHSVNILRAAKEIKEKGLHFSEKASTELNVMSNALAEILSITTEAFIKDDLDLARKVEPLEQVIDGLKVDLKARHVTRLQEGRCTIELGFILSDLVTNYERVSDHCSNIAVCCIQIRESVMDTHDYLQKVKTTGQPEFIREFDHYKIKYTLPH